MTVKNDTKAQRKIEAPHAVDAKKIDITNHRSTMYNVHIVHHDVFKKYDLITYSYVYQLFSEVRIHSVTIICSQDRIHQILLDAKVCQMIIKVLPTKEGSIRRTQ